MTNKKRVAVVAINEKVGQKFRSAIIDLLERAKTVTVVGSNARKDVMIVCGGDGFLLSALRKYRKTTKAFLGINLGTVGFLMNDVAYSDPARVARVVVTALLSDSYREMEYQILRADVEYFGNKKGESLVATNDISIERQSDQAVRLDVAFDEVEMPVYSGDGLLIGTPAGSTGYTISAGGSPIDHRAPVFILTPNNPQKSALFANLTTPVIFAKETRIAISVREAHKRPVRVVIDGAGRRNVKSVKAYIDPHETIKILWLRNWNYFERLGKKIFGVQERRR